MKSRILPYTMVMFALFGAAGCQQPAPISTATSIPPTPAGGYVMYRLRATLDNEPMAALEAIKAASCLDQTPGPNMGKRVVFTFSAQADPIEEAIDDEIGFGLTIQIDDVTQIPFGQPVDVANNPNLHPSALVRGFLPPPQDALTMVNGTITIAALSSNQVTGSAMLTFSDPGDVNVAVQESVVFEVEFTDLAIDPDCAQP